MKRRLIYLYPRAWRQRYGDEFGAVLEQQRLTAADVMDIARGALDAHWTSLLATPKHLLVNHMKLKHWLLSTRGGCLIRGTLVVLLALCCAGLSVRYQRLDALPCQSLGAGFPLPFVCDSSGESPIRSWGKIDAADIVRIVMPALLLNVLFYMLLVLIAWRVVYGIIAVLQRARRST